MATEQVMATKKVNLPGDIIETNILKRVPVKTLIRFTSVCKSWYSLLSDPYFITHRSKNKINNLLFVDYHNRIVVTDSCSKVQSSISSVRIGVVGCCDGIVCASAISCGRFSSNARPRHHISLWNPALRINKIVFTNYESAHFLQSFCFGFGYNNKTKDYNVIRFANSSFTDLNFVEVYSLMSDSWRKVQLSGASQVLTERCIVETFGVYVSTCHPDGAYCWMAIKDLLDAQIISFHMEDDTFKEMTIPYTTGTLDENTLFMYKDSLALLRAHDSYASTSYPVHVSRTFYVWVMKEFGDPKSWTNLWKFDSQRPYVGVSFLGFIETNLILLRFYEKVSNVRTPKEVHAFDIEKSETNPINYTKDISFLAKAKWITSITESLALL